MSASLLDRPTSPVLENAGLWIVDLLSGSVASAICVIAVAALGMMMLTGRISVRRGMQVVLGCFVLLGASTLAGALQGAGREITRSEPVALVIEPQIEPESPLPPAEYNPYAEASVRQP